MRTTPLFAEHTALGAKMAPFAGFMMPMRYSGILREHEAARRSAAVFDTSHMGEILVEGPTAAADLEGLLSCDVASLPAGRCRYGLMCNDAGGVIDDLLVYRMAAESFMLVVNAGTFGKDLAWLRSRASAPTTVRDLQERTAKIDLQGPASPRILASLVPGSLSGFAFYSFRHSVFDGCPVIVSRTGYTGEIGFEIYGEPDVIVRFWRSCLAAGAAPAGLGARDTLRIEMGMPLYGHELSEERNAAESGFTRSLSPTKKFVGSAAIRDRAAKRSVLAGIAMDGRSAARSGDRLFSTGGAPAGVVTSGSYAPSMAKAVAMGYVALEWSEPGTRIVVGTDRGNLAGTVERTPFYGKATGRMPIENFLVGGAVII